jgi:hypothetical protein
MSSLRPLARVAAAALDVVVSSDSTCGGEMNVSIVARQSQRATGVHMVQGGRGSTCTLPLSMEIIATLPVSSPAYTAS